MLSVPTVVAILAPFASLEYLLGAVQHRVAEQRKLNDRWESRRARVAYVRSVLPHRKAPP